MIRYCINCLLPDSKPDLYFNSDGVCGACVAFAKRKEIDWNAREAEFNSILKSSQTNSRWDCIVPVSGGKDSTAQVIKILSLGYTPLCVTATTCDLSDVGRKNLLNIRNLGVDHIEYSPNPLVRKRLNKLALEEIGDISWPEHVGIFTIPIRASVDFGVPLIIWGENSQNEYGGPATSQESKILDRKWLEEFGGLLGLRVSDLVESYGFTPSELFMYQYPTDGELKRAQTSGLFLGHFFPWDGLSNAIVSTAFGFTSKSTHVEGSTVNYENLDNYQTGIHDYFKYLKYGFGRTTDLVSVLIRRGLLTRKEGIEIVKKNDGRFPETYLGKSISQILNEIGLSLPEFLNICDKFTNNSIFETDERGSLRRNSDGSPIKINYDNVPT
jgi:N-acetyl sugar amidotransferase